MSEYVVFMSEYVVFMSEYVVFMSEYVVSMSEYVIIVLQMIVVDALMLHLIIHKHVYDFLYGESIINYHKCYMPATGIYK